MTGQGGAAAPAWDRFAAWPRLTAQVLLAVVALMLVLAAWAPGMTQGLKDAPGLEPVPQVAASAPSNAVTADEAGDKDNDLRLYRLINERVARGDPYYAAATELQRENGYPVAPGLTVRLPTLAFVSAWLGTTGTRIAGVLLLLAVLATNWHRLQAEPGGERFALIGTVLMLLGLSTSIHFQFAVLHEVWAAELMALSFGLHRPAEGKWLAAWLAAAAALSVRELALPFVLLMAAFALWNRRWKEAGAWIVLVAAFALALAVHVHLAEAQLRPGDPVSPPWLVFGGLGGLLYKVIHSSSLNLLPAFLAGPAIVLALLGWSGWKTPAGAFASLLTLGYALAFMIAGRDNNFYWG